MKSVHNAIFWNLLVPRVAILHGTPRFGNAKRLIKTESLVVTIKDKAISFVYPVPLSRLVVGHNIKYESTSTGDLL